MAKQVNELQAEQRMERVFEMMLYEHLGHDEFTAKASKEFGLTIRQCENLWKGRQAEESVDKEPISKVKLMDVDNEEYKARRAVTMTKPDAIVIHETLR